MRRRSIQRPLLIYSLFFTVALAVSLVTLASLSLLRSVRLAQRDILAREALGFAERLDWRDVERMVASGQPELGEQLGVVSPELPALGLSLEQARAAAVRPDPEGSFGALPLRSEGLEAYVVYRLPPGTAFAAARHEIRNLLLIAVAIATLFGVLLALLIMRLVSAPLADLQRVASDVELVEPMLESEVETPNEVAEVAQTFRRTVRQLQEDRQKLEKQHQELERMQAGLIRASKLASVGRLAAGVAHEIGNPLAAVLGYLGLMRRGLGEKETAEVLERSVKELNRIHETIRKMLTYARADESEEAAVPIATGKVVADTIDLLRGHPALRGVEIEVELEPAEELDALGRSGALQQVLMNLLINAGHAAAAAEAPQVRLRRVLEEETVSLIVSDRGPGIPEEVIEHVFDPFFTTKPPGEGTGLGLAVSRALVEAMNGELSVESRPGEGAVFTVRLPRARMSEA